MPIFKEKDGKARQLTPQGFASERALQRFFEANLETLLGVRFVDTEFSTGDRHGGRIDTLGLDEAGAPVIIEYKSDKSDSVVHPFDAAFGVLIASAQNPAIKSP